MKVSQANAPLITCHNVKVEEKETFFDRKTRAGKSFRRQEDEDLLSDGVEWQEGWRKRFNVMCLLPKKKLIHKNITCNFE